MNKMKLTNMFGNVDNTSESLGYEIGDIVQCFEENDFYIRTENDWVMLTMPELELAWKKAGR